MKTNDAIGTVVTTSHRRLARVALYAPDGTPVTDALPVSGGSVQGAATREDRWTARLTVVGDEWAPLAATDPLSGLSRHYLDVFAGAVVDGVEQEVHVCRCIPTSTRLFRSTDEVSVEVDAVGLGGWLARAAERPYVSRTGETCQAMIVRVLADALPPGWSGTVTDTTTPVVVPVGFYNEAASPAQVIADLAAIANVAVYFDAMGGLVIRDPLPASFTDPVAVVAAGTNLSTYTATMGTDEGFANDVEVRFQPVGASGRVTLRSDWNYRVQSGNPSPGQVRRSLVDGVEQWRIHVRDASGKRRGPGLRRVTSGDIVQALAPTGGVSVAEVLGTSDEGSFVSFRVQVLSTEDGGVQNNDEVEIQAYVRLVDDVVGKATWTQPPLDPLTVGKVSYSETVIGNVTQEQADARAQAMLDVAVRAWQTVEVETVPDPRIEPDDDVLLVLPDRTVAARVTAVELPLNADEPSYLGVRAFHDYQPPGPLYPATDLQPATDLFPLGD